jgi:hypothetical protein
MILLDLSTWIVALILKQQLQYYPGPENSQANTSVFREKFFAHPNRISRMVLNAPIQTLAAQQNLARASSF